MTAMLSSQGGIGLITVIAVSGSVMLLALGRQKLLLLKRNLQDSCQSQEDASTFISKPWCRRLLPTYASRRDERKKVTAISVGKPFAFAGQISVTSPVSSAAAPKPCVKKKVRFSEDVVEPSGNSKEYRRRQRLAMRAGPRAQAKTENCSPNVPQAQPKRSNSSSYSALGLSGGPSEASKKLQYLAKPTIPPNRMALYSGIGIGMAQYRSRSSRLYY
eukprot:Gb_27825 [translate_table: standard]